MKLKIKELREILKDILLEDYNKDINEFSEDEISEILSDYDERAEFSYYANKVLDTREAFHYAVNRVLDLEA